MLVDPADRPAGCARRQRRQARPAPHGAQPGHVRGRDRQRARDVLFFTDLARRRRRERLRRADRGLAVVHRALRELRRGDGRGPRQGAGRRRCARHARPTVAHRRRAGRLDRGRAEHRARSSATSSSSPRARSSPATARSIEGIASVDESAITGESAPVIRESGGDRSAVTGGTRVLSDQIVVRITAQAGRDVPRPDDRARRGREPPEDAERDRPQHPARRPDDHLPARRRHAAAVRDLLGRASRPSIVLVALLVCLIPTTIGGLLSAIGIAGMDRLVQRNVLAMSGRAVEAAGDCSTLLLDKTGTITLGNRQAAAFVPVAGVDEARAGRRRAALEPRRRDARGRSIVVLAKERYGLRERELAGATLVPFTAQTRMSGVDLERPLGAQGRRRRGPPLGRGAGRHRPGRARRRSSTRSPRQGGTPLVVAGRARPRRSASST